MAFRHRDLKTTQLIFNDAYNIAVSTSVEFKNYSVNIQPINSSLVVPSSQMI